MKKSKKLKQRFTFMFAVVTLTYAITLSTLWFPEPVSQEAEAVQSIKDVKELSTVDTYDVEYEYYPDVEHETPEEDESSKYFRDYAYEDVILLATLVYLEAGIENDDSQRGVASVVLNRAIIEQATLDEIIYAPNQFTPAYKIPYTTPSQRCIDNVLYVFENGTTLPRYVTYFRADYYFDWGNRYKQYTHYDHTYFSYDTQLYDKYAD